MFLKFQIILGLRLQNVKFQKLSLNYIPRIPLRLGISFSREWERSIHNYIRHMNGSLWKHLPSAEITVDFMMY